jgi:hypothetical protein
MLKRLWLKWIGGCDHTWEIENQGKLRNRYDEITGHFYYLRCSKCGNMKEKQL